MCIFLPRWFAAKVKRNERKMKERVVRVIPGNVSRQWKRERG